MRCIILLLVAVSVSAVSPLFAQSEKKCYFGVCADETARGLRAGPLSASLESWYNCGSGQLAGDAIADARVKATYPHAIVLEVDYAYNPRHMSERPITLRVDAIDDRGIGCGSAFFETPDNVGTGSLSIPIELSAQGSKVSGFIAMLSGIYYPEPNRMRTATPPYVCRYYSVSWTH